MGVEICGTSIRCREDGKRKQMCGLGNLDGRRHLGEQGVDGILILKCNLSGGGEWSRRARKGFVCPRMSTGLFQLRKTNVDIRLPHFRFYYPVLTAVRSTG